MPSQLDLLEYVATAEGVAAERATPIPETSAPARLPQPAPEPPRSRLLLIDANNLVHRLWHSRSSDLPLHERWGFALQRWRRTVQPTHALAIFDGEGDSWRHRAWPAYKGQRDDDPSKRPSGDDWERVKDGCGAAGLQWIQVREIEADDLIASYTIAAGHEGLDVAIISSDKDLMQLARESPRVVQLDPGSGKEWGPAEVFAKWGVWPHSLADVLALAGDSSDNFPGVSGIGPVTAAKLIQEHGELEQLLDRVNVLPAKLSARLAAEIERARLFRRLAGLVTDLQLPVSIESTAWSRRL